MVIRVVIVQYQTVVFSYSVVNVTPNFPRHSLRVDYVLIAFI